MFKKILIGGFISLITLVIIFFAAEFTLKNFVLVNIATGICGVEDPVLKFKGKPNSECTSRTPEWNIKFRLNSFGLHGPETTLEKPEGVYRILFLGDSFTQGYGVEENKAFPRLVEKQLNDHYKGRTKIEIINAGVPNYSPLIEYLYLKNEGLKFNPDLVILEFDLTDFSNDLSYSKEADYDDKGLPLAMTGRKSAESTSSAQVNSTSKQNSSQVTMEKKQLLPFIPKDIKKFFHDRSVLYKWVSTQLKIMKGQPLADAAPEGPNNFYTIVKNDTSYDQLLWKEPKKNLTLIKNLLKEKNIPFIISAHPQGILVNGKEWYNGRLLHGLERDKVYSDRYLNELAIFTFSENIGYINLLPYFKESTTSGMFFPFDGHFNEKGHKVAAEGITKELKKLNLIK